MHNTSRLLPWSASAFALFGLLCGGPAQGQPLQRKVLIIGIDGTMPAALAVARTPNLNALRSNGCFSARAVTHPVTHSAACWTAMFTGVWGDKNGVNDPNNGFNGTRFDLYPNFFRRLENANSNWNTAAHTRWEPLKTALTGCDVVTNFSSDAAMVNATCLRLTNANPDVFYCILLDVDSAGHAYGWGPTVTNYVSAIETADTQVGQILGALTNRVTYVNEDWLVIVLSDHGQHDDTIENSRMTFHLVWNRAAARGTMWPSPAIVDVCANVLTHMGVPLDAAWDLDARLEGYPLPPVRYGTNLIFNGDAESNSGTNNYAIRDDNQNIDRGIAWWFDAEPMTLGNYGAHPNFPPGTSPGPADRGRNFFLGGSCPNSNAVMSQRIDISALACDIARPGVDYELSGFLGGAGTNTASATLVVRFLDVTNAALSTNRIGPVTVTDRGGVTGLLERRATGRLPAGTHFVEFILSMTAPQRTNDASADNLSFVLRPVPLPPLSLRPWVSGADLLVEFESCCGRLYGLERTSDFERWTTLSAGIPGTGARLILIDTNRPPTQAFYRVSWREP
jgi:hypothetical protein